MKKIIYLMMALMFTVVISKGQSGITWTMGNNISTSAYGNEHPRVVTDRNGNALVIWHHSGKAMFSRWNGTAFTTPVMLNPMSVMIAGASWMGPDIASKGDTVYVVYKQMPEADDTSNIFCVHSYNGGLTFSAPVQVDNIADSISRFPTVTVDALGNPIVGFMKFNSSFVESRWVVARSVNFGTSFMIDVKASGWSSMTSTICDCCPGGITCSGNKVAMLYRDNNSNIRDTWAGISSNTGASFTGGMNVDGQNWLLMSCPSAGPDGVIIGDTLYSVFMNGASGDNRTYYSKSSVSGMTGATGTLLTGTIAGMTEQNYPRISASGSAVAVVWKQTISGVDYLPLRFTNNIAGGLSTANDTVDMSNITNGDVALSNGKIVVVWQDDGSGTVKYRMGTYTVSTNSVKEIEQNTISVYPNPATSELRIRNYELGIKELRIYNVLGKKVYECRIANQETSIDISSLVKGIYFVQVKTDNGIYNQKLIKE